MLGPRIPTLELGGAGDTNLQSIVQPTAEALPTMPTQHTSVKVPSLSERKDTPVAGFSRMDRSLLGFGGQRQAPHRLGPVLPPGGAARASALRALR